MREGGGGWSVLISFVGVCDTLPETLYVCQANSCEFSYSNINLMLQFYEFLDLF